MAAYKSVVDFVVAQISHFPFLSWQELRKIHSGIEVYFSIYIPAHEEISEPRSLQGSRKEKMMHQGFEFFSVWMENLILGIFKNILFG